MYVGDVTFVDQGKTFEFDQQYLLATEIPYLINGHTFEKENKADFKLMLLYAKVQLSG